MFHDLFARRSTGVMSNSRDESLFFLHALSLVQHSLHLLVPAAFFCAYLALDFNTCILCHPGISWLKDL